MSGVTVRALHYYDKIGLLKPLIRTEGRYRRYGEKELLRLQQILFYKELDFNLETIRSILDDADFDMINALETHRSLLLNKRARIETLLHTVDKTIAHLKKNSIMLNTEDLYEGLHPETVEKYRQEARQKYGEESVHHSEEALKRSGITGYRELKQKSGDNIRRLFPKKHLDPASPQVQQEIAEHYQLIRQFWGTSGLQDRQAESYTGLGRLYVDDERFTMVDNQPQPEFAVFMSRAMEYFARTTLS